jgi:hypothetical protein
MTVSALPAYSFLFKVAVVGASMSVAGALILRAQRRAFQRSSLRRAKSSLTSAPTKTVETSDQATISGTTTPTPTPTTKITPPLASDNDLDAALLTALHVGPDFASKRRALKSWRETSSTGDGRVGLIADFDRTFTAANSAQCHDVMGNSLLMPMEFRQEMEALLDFSHPQSESLTSDEWWGKANSLVLEHGLRKEMLPSMVAQAKPGFVARNGLLELLALCQRPMAAAEAKEAAAEAEAEAEVGAATEAAAQNFEAGGRRSESSRGGRRSQQYPLLIVSAGFSDVIETYLHDLWQQNRHSFRLTRWQNEGKIGGAVVPPLRLSVSANRMHFEDDEVEKEKGSDDDNAKRDRGRRGSRVNDDGSLGEREGAQLQSGGDGGGGVSGGGGQRLIGWLPKEGPCHSHNKASTFNREASTPGGFFFEPPSKCDAHNEDEAAAAAAAAAAPLLVGPGVGAGVGAGVGVKHWLVMGDRPYDVHAAAGLPKEMKEVELKIGFMDIKDNETEESKQSRLIEFADVFDLVLPSRGTSLHPVVDLLLE